MVALTFRETSFARAFARIDVGLALFAVPALQGLGFALEALGWRAILASLGERTSFRALLRVRVMSEAIAQSLPLGVLVAEGSKPLLLRDQTAVSLPTGTASVAARKYSLVATQALLLAVVAAFGAGPFAHIGRAVPGGGTTLRAIVLGGALVLAVSAAFSGHALGRGAVAEKLHRLLVRLPILGRRMAQTKTAFTAADDAAARYFGRPIVERVGRALPFLMAWAVESVETWFLLRLVGVELDLWTAFCLEVPIGLLRSVAFFTPAGLGVQDLGYATALAAFGVPDAAAAALAFTVLKRCKEVLWVAVGWTLLVSGATPRVTTAVADPTGTAA